MRSPRLFEALMTDPAYKAVMPELFEKAKASPMVQRVMKEALLSDAASALGKMHDIVVEATKEYNIANNKKWHFQSFMCGSKYAEEWQGSNIQNFDWEKIKRLLFDAHFSGTGTGSFWIDNLYFGKSRWSATAENATSQASYGLRELAIVDETLVSDDTCAKVADAELSYRKDPAEFLRVTVIGDPQLVAGETIRVVSPNENIDAEYRIQTVAFTT